MNTKDIWIELDALYNYPEREQDDITAEQVAEKYNITIDAARRRMKKIARKGGCVYITVRDANAACGSRKVLRGYTLPEQ